MRQSPPTFRLQPHLDPQLLECPVHHQRRIPPAGYWEGSNGCTGGDLCGRQQASLRVHARVWACACARVGTCVCARMCVCVCAHLRKKDVHITFQYLLMHILSVLFPAALAPLQRCTPHPRPPTCWSSTNPPPAERLHVQCPHPLRVGHLHVVAGVRRCLPGCLAVKQAEV